MTAPVGERTLPLDPRLRARRREIRRHRGLRRLRRLQAGLGAIALGAGGWGVALSPVADVDDVVVQGAMRSGAGLVEEATGIDRGEAMATLDLDEARTAVQALPWVATAAVRRHWPGRVIVTVAERRPVAVVAAVGESSVVVDRHGRQLAVVDEDSFSELPLITGLAPKPDPGATLGGDADAPLELAGLLPQAVPGEATEVTVVEGSLEVRLLGETTDGTLVRFGQFDRLVDKVTALAALVDAGVVDEAGSPLVVDVRVPDAPVLTRAES